MDTTQADHIMAPRKIMVAVDGSPSSRDALDYATLNLLLVNPRDADELHIAMVRPPITQSRVPTGKRSSRWRHRPEKRPLRRIVGLA